MDQMVGFFLPEYGPGIEVLQKNVRKHAEVCIQKRPSNLDNPLLHLSFTAAKLLLTFSHCLKQYPASLTLKPRTIAPQNNFQDWIQL